jgi:anti-sigma regulatory factor (Ser/Thr protein kinase)
MSDTAEQVFAGDPRSPAAARGFARASLADLLDRAAPDPLCDDLELVVSELVTNAVRAGSPNVGVAISVDGDRLVVRVSDEAGGWPEPRDADIYDTGGRGLPLVSAISTSWGVRMSGAGKVVWAELRIPAEGMSAG